MINKWWNGNLHIKLLEIYQKFPTFLRQYMECQTEQVTYSVGGLGNILRRETRMTPTTLSRSLPSLSMETTIRLPSAVPTVNYTHQSLYKTRRALGSACTSDKGVSMAQKAVVARFASS